MRTLVFAFLLRLAASALADDVWTSPFAGVRRLHRVMRELQVHAPEIHLEQSGMSLRSTTSAERKQTTSSFAKSVGAQLAINADFFGHSDSATDGLSAGNGVAWEGTSDDEVTSWLSSFSCFVRHPRTALGLSRDQKTLYLVVVDGRSAASVGMTCAELAALLKGFGSWTAMNLDGGGSSTMYGEGR